MIRARPSPYIAITVATSSWASCPARGSASSSTAAVRLLDPLEQLAGLGFGGHGSPCPRPA